MMHRLVAMGVAIIALTPALASANPEPTTYDSQSTAMGLTGTSYLERPAALAINPANLEGIDTLGFTINFSALLVDQWAPVVGPNTRVESGLGFGPLPAGFIAGRIAPRVVFGAGIYIETGYGSDFDNIECIDGDPVGPPPDYTPSTPPDCTRPQPSNLDVTFFIGEFAAGTSIRVTDKLWLGVALRLPFSKQVADLVQNIGAVITPGQPPLYRRIKNDLGGVGFPSPRFGITWKPHKKISLGAMYRVYSRIKLSGTTTLFLNEAPGAEPLELNSTADWTIPHALQAGIAIKPNERLLLAIEGRVQFHGAKRTGNKNQTVVATDPDGVFPEFTTVVPFGWKNAWSVKFGAQYRFPIDLLAIRGGVNFAQSATSEEWAQYFTPPAGFSGFLSSGLGFYWDDERQDQKDKYMLDITGAFAFSGGTIGEEFIDTTATIPGTDEQVQLCSQDQVVRTGCPGDLGVFSWFITLGFTLQY